MRGPPRESRYSPRNRAITSESRAVVVHRKLNHVFNFLCGRQAEKRSGNRERLAKILLMHFRTGVQSAQRMRGMLLFTGVARS